MVTILLLAEIVNCTEVRGDWFLCKEADLLMQKLHRWSIVYLNIVLLNLDCNEINSVTAKLQ